MGCWHTKIKRTKIFQQRIFTTRLFFYSYSTGCEKEQELLASRLCKCLLAPGYHAVYCTSLHKKSEQSFFARVKVRRSTTTPFFSLKLIHTTNITRILERPGVLKNSGPPYQPPHLKQLGPLAYTPYINMYPYKPFMAFTSPYTTHFSRIHDVHVKQDKMLVFLARSSAVPRSIIFSVSL